MGKIDKYRGVFPAFYACYDDSGRISPDRTRAMARFLIGKGVDGLYVCGSSGECIYQTKEERMLALESVMEEAKGKVTVIAHVAATSTGESVKLAQHAASCGVDALAAIPPIYFKLPEYSIEQYWKAMIDATDLDLRKCWLMTKCVELRILRCRPRTLNGLSVSEARTSLSLTGRTNSF